MMHEEWLRISCHLRMDQQGVKIVPISSFQTALSMLYACAHCSRPSVSVLRGVWLWRCRRKKALTLMSRKISIEHDGWLTMLALQVNSVRHMTSRMPEGNQVSKQRVLDSWRMRGTQTPRTDYLAGNKCPMPSSTTNPMILSRTSAEQLAAKPMGHHVPSGC